MVVFISSNDSKNNKKAPNNEKDRRSVDNHGPFNNFINASYFIATATARALDTLQLENECELFSRCPTMSLLTKQEEKQILYSTISVTHRKGNTKWYPVQPSTNSTGTRPPYFGPFGGVWGYCSISSEKRVTTPTKQKNIRHHNAHDYIIRFGCPPRVLLWLSILLIICVTDWSNP